MLSTFALHSIYGLGPETTSARGWLCHGRGVQRVSAPLPACTTRRSPPTRDKSRPHSRPQSPSTRGSALSFAPRGITLEEQGMTATLCRWMFSSGRKKNCSRALPSLNCRYAGGDCFIPTRRLQQSLSPTRLVGSLPCRGLTRALGTASVRCRRVFSAHLVLPH